MNRKNVLIALTAGTACALPALGQTYGVVEREMPDGSFVNQPAVFATGTTGNSYGARAEQTVLDNLTGFFSSGTLQTLGTNHIVEDFSFNPGPWAGAASRDATKFEWSFFIGAWTSTASPAFTYRIKFWNQAALNTGVAGANMIGTPTQIGADFVVAFADGAIASPPPAGYVTIYDYTSTLTAGTYLFPADGFLAETSIHDPANPSSYAYFATTQINPYVPAGFPAATQSLGLANNAKPIAPGSSIVGYGRDLNGDTVFNSGAAVNAGTAPNNEWRSFATSTLGPRHQAFKVYGNVVTPPPPVDVDLGCLTDAGATANVPGRVTGPTSKAVIKFCLSGDATDNARKFVDMIGDQGAGVPFTFAVYNDGGVKVAQSISNEGDGGSIGVPMLTFGTGRRAAAYTGGVPRDGRDGQLAAGTYYMLVSGPGAGFGDSYTVSVPDPSLDSGSACQVRFETNTVGGALAPSVAPVAADYGGSDVALPPSFTTPAFQPPALRVTWFTFTLCEDVGDNAAGEYLDLDSTGSPSSSGDTEMFLFDNAGNLRATNDDYPAAAPVTGLAALTFQAPGTPARTTAAFGASLDGADGTLSAGQYYVAYGLFDVTTLAAADRWHVRATSGSSNIFSIAFNTDIDCAADGCPCVADFDGSGGTPDAGDIDAFFSAWLLGDPSADADCSGGTPDASDIDVFFTEWLNGGC